MPDPKRGVAFTFDALLFDTGTNEPMESPPIVAGDVKVKLDSGAYANITTLPAGVAGAPDFPVTLSAAEMLVNVSAKVRFKDQTVPAAWQEVVYVIAPNVQTVDDLPNAAAVNAQADLALADVGLTSVITGRIDAAMSSRATPAQVNAEADQALIDVGLTPTVTGRLDTAVSTRATPAEIEVGPAVVQALADVGLTSVVTGRIDAAISSRAGKGAIWTPPGVEKHVPQVFTLKHRDTFPVYEPILRNPDGSVHALPVGAIYKAHIRLNNGTTLTRDMDRGELAADGKVRYAWVPADWNAGGLIVGPVPPIQPDDVEHTIEVEEIGPGPDDRLTFPSGGYDILRIIPDLGQG